MSAKFFSKILLFPLFMATLFLSSQAYSADTPEFRHGFNLMRTFSFAKPDKNGPGGYTSPPFDAKAWQPDDSLLHRLRAGGFDFIRLPVEPGPFLALGADEKARMIEDVATTVKRFRSHHYAVIVDLHPAISDARYNPKTILDDPQGPLFSAYRSFTHDITQMIAGMKDDRVALELMNEPQRECVAKTGTDWQVYQKTLYDDVRSLSKTIPVFITGGCWAQIAGAVELTMEPFADDPRVYVSVHFYDPYQFTHQGAFWSLPVMRGLSGLPYPSDQGSIDDTMARTVAAFSTLKGLDDTKKAELTDEGRKQVQQYFRGNTGHKTLVRAFDKLSAWADSNNVPANHIVFTEIGALRQMDGDAEFDKPSRLRWFEDTTTLLHDRKWGWGLWALNPGGFGLFAKEGDSLLDEDMAKAMGLTLKNSER